MEVKYTFQYNEDQQQQENNNKKKKTKKEKKPWKITQTENRLSGQNLDAEVIAAAETWLDGQPSELFLSGLLKSEFGHCSFVPSLSG